MRAPARTHTDIVCKQYISHGEFVSTNEFESWFDSRAQDLSISHISNETEKLYKKSNKSLWVIIIKTETWTNLSMQILTYHSLRARNSSNYQTDMRLIYYISAYAKIVYNKTVMCKSKQISQCVVRHTTEFWEPVTSYERNRG